MKAAGVAAVEVEEEDTADLAEDTDARVAEDGKPGTIYSLAFIDILHCVLARAVVLLRLSCIAQGVKCRLRSQGTCYEIQNSNTITDKAMGYFAFINRKPP